MPVASLRENQDILYPATGTLTNIEQWDMSLLNCVFTHIQRKLIINEIGNPIDPVIKQYKAQVLATTVGQEHEEQLYPRSGKPTNVNKWNMSLCSCILSVLSLRPQTLCVKIAQSLNSLREMRNSLCHTKCPEMEPLVYEEHFTVLKQFINSGLTYIGDDAFETEIKEDIGDIENGRMRCYILTDHRHLQKSYADERDTSQRLDRIEKAIQKLTSRLQDQDGMRVVSAKRECLNVKIRFDNAVRMWQFIKYYISGSLDSLFEPIQTLLRTKKEFENLEMTVVVPDVFAAFDQSGEAQEIGSISMMCVLEMLNQRLIPLEEKQQDDTKFQHDKENADIRTWKKESDEPEETLVEKTERLCVDEYKTPLEKLYLDESGRKITTTLTLKPSEKLFEEFTIDESGKKVKILLAEKLEKPTEEVTVDKFEKKGQTFIPEKLGKPIEEFTIDEAGKKVKTTKKGETLIIGKTVHNEEFTIDESGQKVKTLIKEEVKINASRQKHLKSKRTRKLKKKSTIGKSGERSLTTVEPKPMMTLFSRNRSESKKGKAKEIESRFIPVDETQHDDTVLQWKMTNFEQDVDASKIDKLDGRSLPLVEPKQSMAIFSSNTSESKKVRQADEGFILNFTLDTTIQVNYPSDCLACRLSNILLLPGNSLLLADHDNKNVKLIDLWTNNLMSCVSMPVQPMGMCVLPEHQVAVCLPITGTAGRIQFLGVLGKLSLNRSIEVTGGCRGIGYLENRLIVSFMSGKVCIMTMSGKVIKMIGRNNSGQSIFVYPLHLTVVSEGQKGVIYASDSAMHTITKLDMDLNILQTFEDPALRGPRGITAVGNQLLICGLYSNNIMSLDLQSSQMTQLLRKKDGVQKPMSVCYSQQQNKLYVLCDK
ncbi:hypothetical protein MAR_018770 [Mya arenaria]|uniref:Uncharacterized protein n=1 Tax=Mya arenaria TaxID=6604 RepID=A0ABY7EFN0_MYAAR|nr:hypothetical protein MAR_018770 [Mya arenaria]